MKWAGAGYLLFTWSFKEFWLTEETKKQEREMVKDENHINSLCEVSFLSTAIPFAQHQACCRELTVNNSTAWDGSVGKCAVKPEPLLPLSSRNAQCLMLSARACPEAGAVAPHLATVFAWGTGEKPVTAGPGWEAALKPWSAASFWRDSVCNLQMENLS